MTNMNIEMCTSQKCAFSAVLIMGGSFPLFVRVNTHSVGMSSIFSSTETRSILQSVTGFHADVKFPLYSSIVTVSLSKVITFPTRKLPPEMQLTIKPAPIDLPACISFSFVWCLGHAVLCAFPVYTCLRAYIIMLIIIVHIRTKYMNTYL